MLPVTRKGPSRFHRLGVFLLVLVLEWLQGGAYRIGEAVDVIYKTPTESMDAKRHQRPLFGVPSDASFDEQVNGFSLSFEDGVRALPWVNVVDSNGRRLESLSVTFVYSKSGEGAIHAVSSEKKYSSYLKGVGPFQVKYDWVEEASVDMALGMTVMFLATLVVSVLFLLQTCGDSDEGSRRMEGVSASYGGYNTMAPTTTAGSGSEPKWD